MPYMPPAVTHKLCHTARLQALALLALGLLAAQATRAARMFDHSRPVKRGVGRRYRDGKLVGGRHAGHSPVIMI